MDIGDGAFADARLAGRVTAVGDGGADEGSMSSRHSGTSEQTLFA